MEYLKRQFRESKANTTNKCVINVLVLTSLVNILLIKCQDPC